MALLPVAEVYERLLGDAVQLDPEDVGIAEAAGRVLAKPVVARRTQPPFDASAMDGYAVQAADTVDGSVAIRVTGESAAGRRFEGAVGPREAVRIFTGAPVPPGADSVLIQEDAAVDGQTIRATEAVALGKNIRKAGLDFRQGDELLPAGRMLDPGALSLAAAANYPTLAVVRRPRVAILATGDELVLPGTEPGPDQIIASNTFGVASIARSAGADVIDLGVVPDDNDLIAAAVRRGQAEADILVTLGGASVGDHDLVRGVLEGVGMALSFWKIAMRPGKPLMFGRLGAMRVLGLPGNPVSSLVCSHLFLAPLIAKLAGRPHELDIREAALGSAMKENDQRQDYVRAATEVIGGRLVVTPFAVQDSSMLNTLARADAVIIRPPHAPAAAAGETVEILKIR